MARVQKLMSEALKALQEGDIILEEATVGHETLNLDLVFDAVDKEQATTILNYVNILNYIFILCCTYTVSVQYSTFLVRQSVHILSAIEMS